MLRVLLCVDTNSPILTFDVWSSLLITLHGTLGNTCIEHSLYSSDDVIVFCFVFYGGYINNNEHYFVEDFNTQLLWMFYYVYVYKMLISVCKTFTIWG